MSKILITSVSAGAGHVRAAAAVEAYLNDEHDVHNVDLMTFASDWFRNLYTEQYLNLVNKYPNIWSKLYSLTDKPASNWSERVRRYIEDHAHSEFFKYVEELNPDLVISSHFMPPEILQSIRDKSGLKFKILTVVTDFDVHYLWVNPWTDLYLVAGQKARQKLLAYQIPKEKIVITGIPVMPQFFNPASNVQELHKKWNTNNNYIKAILMAGGAGVGSLDEQANALLSHNKELQLIALAGRNQALLDKLNTVAEKFPGRLRPMGFTTEVDELMQISDLVITKPGGLSTSECIALKKPMVLINAIPGQEEHNARYLSELGLAAWVSDPKELVTVVSKTIKNLADYQNNYQKITTLDTEKLIKDIVKAQLD